MTKRLFSLFFAALFAIMCVVPLAGLALTGGAKAGANEVLAAKPALIRRDGSLNGDYLADLADYIGDRFYLRQECVTAWAKLNAALWRTSVTEDVVLGSDGWLYFAPTLADYTRTAPMTERELWCAARTLALLQEHAESRGRKFIFTIAPNKNSLYDASMPELPRAEGASNAERLQLLLDDMGVHYLDLFAVFDAQDEVLYFPTDSHWNAKGAARAADAINAALGRESAVSSGPFTPGAHKGDLYEMLYPAGKAQDEDLIYTPGFTFTANTQNPDNARITAEGPGTGELLLYRDSFGRNLYPYLAESFETSVFSRKNDYDPTAMADGGALIIELVERNLRYLNTYAPSLPAPERDAALIEGTSARGELPVTIADGSVSGSFGELRPDEDSPVYIAVDGNVYEAVPQPEGFSAVLSVPAGELHIVFTCGGELISLLGIIE